MSEVARTGRREAMNNRDIREFDWVMKMFYILIVLMVITCISLSKFIKPNTSERVNFIVCKFDLNKVYPK